MSTNKISIFIQNWLKNNPLPILPQMMKDLVTPEQNSQLNKVFQILYEHIDLDHAPIAFGGKIKDRIIKRYAKKFQTDLRDEIKKTEIKIKEKLIEKLGNQLISLSNELVINTFGMELNLVHPNLQKLFFLQLPKIYWNKKKEHFLLDRNNLIMSCDLKLKLPESARLVRSKSDKESLFWAPLSLEKIEKLYNEEQQSKFNYLHKYSIPFPNLSYYNHIEFLNILRSNMETVIDEPDIMIFEKKKEKGGSSLCTFLNSDPYLMSSLKDLKTDFPAGYGGNNYLEFGTVLSFENALSLTLMNHAVLTPNSVFNLFAAIINLISSINEYPHLMKIRIKNKGKIGEVNSQYNTANSSIIRNKDLPYWTQNELDKLAEERGIVNLPTWTEKDLEDLAIKRGIIQLPKWTEEELEEYNKSKNNMEVRANWTPDPDTFICPDCGYTLQPDWDECPICGYQPKKSKTNQSEKKHEREKREVREERQEDKEEEIWHPPQED